jgi:hypothetical protein
VEKRVGQALKVQSDMDVKREQLADVLRKVCVCVCMYLYVSYVCVCMYVSMYARVSVCMYVFMYVCIYV